MSISATPSIWNAVEIAIRGANALDRPLEHAPRGSSPSNSTRARRPPARRSARTCSRCHLLSHARFFAGSRPASAPSSSSVRRRENAVNDLARRAAVEPAARSSPSTAASSSSVGTRRKSEPPIAGVGAEPAAHEDVVGLPRARRPRRATVVPWKPRSPTQCCAHACGQPSRCSRRSAICVAERRSSRCSISRPRRVFVSATEKLQCGSPVQAIEFAAHAVDVEREADRRRAPRRPRRRARSGRR